MAELWPGGPLTLPHTFTHDGIELTIPQLPTVTLLHWLAGGQWWQLYPASVDQDALTPLVERLFNPRDRFDLVHLWDVAITLYSRLAGLAPPDIGGWWAGVRLANTAVAQWPQFNSWCVERGIAVPDGSLMTVIGAAYGWLRSGIRAEDLPKLEQQLWAVPTKVAAPSLPAEEVPEHVRQAEAGAFLAALGEQLPGQAPAATAIH